MESNYYNSSTNSLIPLTSLHPRFLGLHRPGQRIELVAAGIGVFTLTLCTTVTISYYLYITLYRLFSEIVDDALTEWAQRPPSNQVVLEAGNMRIEFGCAMLEPVPWEFIAEMAESGRDAVSRGFMPFFERQWWWVRNGTAGDDGEGEGEGEGGRMCYVGIRVVEKGRVVVPPPSL